MIEKHSWHVIALGIPAEKGLMLNKKVFASLV